MLKKTIDNAENRWYNKAKIRSEKEKQKAKEVSSDEINGPFSWKDSESEKTQIDKTAKKPIENRDTGE